MSFLNLVTSLRHYFLAGLFLLTTHCSPPHPPQSPPTSPAKSICSPRSCWSPVVLPRKTPHAPAQSFPIPQCWSQKSASASHPSAPPQLSPAQPQYSESFAPFARKHRPHPQSS